MNDWEAILKKLENGKSLDKSEIDYLKRVHDAANTFIKIALELAAETQG